MSHRKQNNNNTNIPSKSKGKPSFPQSAEKKEAKYETGSIEGSAKKTPQEVASPKKEELIRKSIDEATSPGPPEDLAVTLSKEEPSLLLGRTEKKQDADSYREEFREGELGLHLFSKDDPKEVDSVENLVNLKTGEIQERMNVQFNLMTADLSAQIERLGNRFSQRFEGVEKMHVKFNNDVNENMLGLRQYLFEHLDAMEEKVNKLDSKNKIFEDQNKTFIGEMDMARGSPSLISPIPQTFNKPKVIPEPKPAQAKAAKTNLSSDFADEGFLTNKKRNTRESILKRLSMGADAPVHAVTYTRVAPSYTHIKMERLTLSQLIKFTEDIFAYTTSYKISLPVSTLISDRVRDQLIAHHRGMTVTKFHALSVEDILSYLLKEVCPESPLIFYKTLAQYVKIELPPSYKPTPLDFKLFYNALLVYKDKFIRVYEMLSEDNDVNTPPCNNKEGGLIRLFLEGIPFQYGSKKFQAMSSTSSQKYDDIYSFTRDFMVAVEEDFERSKQATVMSHHFSGTALVATPSKAATRPSQTHATQRFHEVRHVKHQEEEFDDHEDEPESSGDEIDDQEEEESFLQELDALGNDRNSRFAQRSNFSQNNPDRTRAPFTIMRKDKPKTGCFRMLFHGSCEKGDKCSYAHDPNTLSKMHDYYANLLRTSKFKPTRTDVSRNDPVAVLEEAEPDQALLAQVDEFLHLSFSKIREPTEDLAKAVHRQGAVKLPGGTRLLVADALFDTGAVHASYISKQFVDAHHDCLEPYRVKIRKNVQLADKVTIIPVEDAYDLNVSFSDDGGQLHEAKVLFWALPQCNHEMIIGLPAIIHHFHSLHKHMLDVVVDILEKKDSQSLSTVAEVQYPWSYVQEEVAPEDLDTPLPSSFPDALHFMEMSHEEAVKEFHSQFEKHVHKDFAEATPILALLKEKGTHVFVPQNWEGIKGVPDIDLELKEGMPQILKPRARPVNPKLYENAKKEFDRLKKYFYRDSNSDIASCLVIAPKATAPFIRFCGDYVAINKFIVTGHYPIPHVQHTLERIIRYNVFLDFDLANSFHQFRLTKRTSALLSVQTPWGQVEPIFMPEGIGPASGILQKAMFQIFADFQEWAIVIFDNLLVMATDYEDAYRKVELVLDRCLHHNVCLKFSKTWLGFSEANFFGYVCRKGCYELSQARKDAIYEFPFPNSLKQMQSFLGSALFFKSFVKDFSSLASPLYDMVKKEFNWDESSWKEVDYRMAFQHFKEALVAATAIYYPNYEHEWILRTDASRFGIGAVLLQVCPVDDNSPPILQPITFFSQKFSDQATRWSTIEQEAYAIFAAVRHFAYYLTCKPFILETDHNNLLYMEQSIVPKIVRWRVYLQSFSFMLRHIPGKENTVADWLSRVHERDTPNTHPVELANAEPTTPEELLRRVHGGRMGHYGARRTWKLLGTFFPGHHIPYHVVEEFVATCPICQKSRLGMTDSIQPVVRHLKPEGRRSMVGVDTLTITPPDKNGFKYLVVIVNHFTKFAVLVPTKTKDALTVAHALFTYFATFGLVDCIISDPGSEYENQLLEHLHSWLGIRHRFSLVERHESNGVEGTNKQILRHLRALVLDERVVSHWVSLIPFIQFMLNSTDNSETGVIPYHAHFGTADETYCRLPLPDGTHEGREGDGTVSIDPADFDIKNMAKLTQAYLSALDKNLAVLYKISKEYQAKIALERTKDTPSDKQNTYQKGDFVLWQRNPDDPLPTKLTTPFVGPFEVLEQYKNDVECRHVLHGNIQKFHVSRLKLFHGNKETAKEVAQLDQDQHTIKTIHSHRGDPALRSTMTFKVEFDDGDVRMLPWSKDLFDSLPYESYCRNHPELTSLLYTVDLAKTFERDLSKTPITAVKPGDECFVDLRYLGHLWYDEQVPFEDKDETYYLLHGRYYTWENKTHTKISIKFSVLKQVYVVDNIFIQRYGYRRVFPESGAKLVDEALVKEYPVLLKQNQKGGRANSSTTKKR